MTYIAYVILASFPIGQQRKCIGTVAQEQINSQHHALVRVSQSL